MSYRLYMTVWQSYDSVAGCMTVWQFGSMTEWQVLGVRSQTQAHKHNKTAKWLSLVYRGLNPCLSLC